MTVFKWLRELRLHHYRMEIYASDIVDSLLRIEDLLTEIRDQEHDV